MENRQVAQYPMHPMTGQTHVVVTTRNLSRRGLVVLLPLALALGACAGLPQRPELPVEVAIPEGSGSQLDSWFAGHEKEHTGQSAFRLLAGGAEAFVTRLKSANAASRSIDVQTYIWHADTTGWGWRSACWRRRIGA